ncbi:hypothetical protein ACHQM5_025351 [Ranunculus cassubicifolius]
MELSGFCIGVLLLLIGIFFLYSGLQKRKLAQLKERFFKQNGGLLLQQHEISVHKSGGGATRIYTAEELQKATNNYDETHIIGRGGNGTVYKGVLAPDNKIIAIKKSKIVDETQIEQFINELVILTQINHKHVVKLLGCCLETQVPLLVYEFISNGTLYQHIHSRENGGTVLSIFSWYNCLRIATEVSNALAYLHSAASIPIIHRDVKSTNILLDDNYSAKVADFGASRLIPLDQTQVSTLIQGTMGYLDPECYQTGMLTEKSDVYSFGVVLAEILTGKTPLSFEKSDVCRSLATYFISAMKENALLQIVDDRLVDEADREQLLAVADLAMRCLTWKGEERPTMKDVLEELEGHLKLVEKHPWDQENTEETVSLLEDQSDLYPRAAFSISVGESSGQYSLNLSNSLMSPLNLPR